MEDVAKMQSLFNSGDRGGAYLYYYQLTGSVQTLIQAQITTGSGTFGGGALYGNYLAKSSEALSSDGYYDLTLEDFSTRILQANIDAIQMDILKGDSGHYGILDDETLQGIDQAVWTGLGMKGLFSGNLQFPSQDPYSAITPGFFKQVQYGPHSINPHIFW
ncbi:MAG: hypothetical protein V4732_06660 [Pseudomonadota bacterium]